MGRRTEASIYVGEGSRGVGLGDPDEVTLSSVLCMARRNYIDNIKKAMDVTRLSFIGKRIGTRLSFMVGFADSQVCILTL